MGDDDAHDPLLLACPLGPDGTAATPVACLRLRRRIGLTQPRYWFHVGYRVHAAAELGMFRRERTLLLGNDHTGAAELADFGIDAARLQPAQRAALPRMLVGAALLLLHRDQQRRVRTDALPRVIATLPGARDDDGATPFWEGLGCHFYPGDVAQALARFGHLWRTHVAALLPRQPVYTCLLPAPTRAALAQVHPGSLALMQVLWDAGLQASQTVRSPAQCTEAAADQTVLTAMMEWRALVADARWLAERHGAAAAALGDPTIVPWLIEQMASPELARLAGGALTMITGVDLAAEKLSVKAPAGFEAGPSDDPADENVAMDPDESLPWPDAARVAAWWKQRSGALSPGKRYLLGQALSPGWLEEVLRRGNQQARAAAALERCVLSPGKALFEVRAPGHWQRGWLSP